MPRGQLLMLFSSACFGVMGLLVAVAHHLQPELSVAMSSLVRAAVNLLLLVGLYWRHPLRLFGDARPALWIRGVFGATALLSYFAAVARVGVGEAAFLNQTSGFWVVLLAPFFLKERSSPRAWAAVAGASLGTYLLAVPQGSGEGDPLGRWLGVLSGFLAAGAYLTVRRAGESNPPPVIVFYFTLLAVITSGGLLQLEPVLWPQDGWIWLTLVGVGIMATAGQLLMTAAYRIGPAATMATLAYATPVCSSLLGWAFLEQVPGLTRALGMLLILVSGVALPLLEATASRAGSHSR